MKKCTKCHQNKNEFAKRASSSDGLDSRCLDCVRETSKESAEKNRIKCKTIPDQKSCSTCRLLLPSSAFGTIPTSKDGLRAECKSCRNIKAKQKYATDEDFRKHESYRFAKMYIANPNKFITKTKRWAKENPDKKIEQRHRRIARTHGQYEFNLPYKLVGYLRSKFTQCIYCGDKDKLTVEHVVPLSRQGRHELNNLTLACGPCNYSKNDKTPEEWLLFNENLLAAGVQSIKIEKICESLRLILSG